MNHNCETGILIIHGFGGSQEEVAVLEQYLVKENYRVSVPVLPGHGDDRGSMSRATRHQWDETVAEAYELLAKSCKKTYVIGFSMGGLLAVRLLASKYPSLNRQDERLGGLITVNTPVYYWNFRQIFINLFCRDQNRDGNLRWMRRYLSSASGLPIRSMLQFQILLSGTKRLYGRIYCPALIIQLGDDDAVWPASGDYILRRMRGKRSLVKLPCGGHQIFQSEEAPEACRLIEEFIRDGVNGKTGLKSEEQEKEREKER